MLIQDAEIDGLRADLRIVDGIISEIAKSLAPAEGEPCIDAQGAALLPGLHDHHIHLNAAAAALQSVVCGPPAVFDAAGLAAALRAAPGTGWLRGVNYHASVAGEIDRVWLDRHGPARPVRIQQRSGRLWIFNSAALDVLGAGAPADGRLLDRDDWLAARLVRTPPDLAALGRVLAGYGVTGVTDATARNTRGDRARYEACLPGLNICVMGSADLTGQPGAGPLKLHYHEDALPPLDDLIGEIAAAHAAGRPVAAHCVTRAELFLVLAGIEAAGAHTGDRIEHAALAPPEAVAWIARLGLTVVTQPHFIAERQAAYLTDVPAPDRDWLYRLRGWRDAGVRLAAGSDAPLGGLDPWRAMAAAVARPAGLAPREALSPEAALRLYLGAAGDPGGPARQMRVGARADLCLLDRPWAQARLDLAAVRVRATLRGGEMTYTDRI